MKSKTLVIAISCLAACSHTMKTDRLAAMDAAAWVLVDNFEVVARPSRWQHVDTDNRTEPFVPDPQVAIVQFDDTLNNHYLLKKPAAEGVVGNRKALSYIRLPQALDVGDVATFYTRVNVEYFPNNHSFGLSNLTAAEIAEQNYNAFEPMLRITDKFESNGYKNDGTLMVMVEGRSYEKISNPETGEPASPLETNTWYELWYVVNNASAESGGQSYDVYMRGGEFESQQLVFSGASFRMAREQPLINFIAICNTGPKDKPYGNGGVRYDDIYMASGVELTQPPLSTDGQK